MADLIDRDAAIRVLSDYAETQQDLDYYRDMLMKISPVNRWIPCETELPYGGKRVLVTTAEGNVVDAIFVLKGNQWFRNGEYFQTDRVIAWMPMPDAYEPPKE